MQPRLSLLQVILTLICLLTFSFISLVSAHEIRPAVVDINLDETGAYKISIKINLEAKISNIGNAHQDTDESNNAGLYDVLRDMPAESLAQEFLMFEDKLLENITLKINDQVQKLEIISIDIPDVGDIELARDSIVYIQSRLPEDAKAMTWQWDKSLGNVILRVSSKDKPELYSAYLLDGKISENIPLSIKQIKTINSTWNSFTNYVQVGFVHIVPKGLDHILFVIGLFLLSASLRPLLIQVTTFTIAHSVTLALGIYGIISVPSSIVEPLIAASIIYIGLENIYSDKLSKWRPLVIFLFGLLHGLGFASVLKEIGLSSGNYITSLIGFNVGVEVGQLSVIAACFLLVGVWFRHKKWYRQRVTVPASILISIVAIYWLIERTFLA